MTQRTQLFLSRNYSVAQLLEKQNELNEYTLLGWKGLLSVDHFATQIIAEAGEYLTTDGLQYKWWKAADPALLDTFNLKIEGIDIVHFYLSMIILWNLEGNESGDSCGCGTTDMLSGTSFDQFRSLYIGTDEGPGYLGGGLLEYVNNLNHHVFAARIRSLLCEQFGGIYAYLRTLGAFVAALGLTSEEFSALYAAKSKLNEIRQEQGYADGTYVKVTVEGVEDNQRLEPLIDAFLADETMTLEQLRENVFNEFYDVVEPS